MRALTWRQWWQRTAAPLILDNRMLVVASGPLLGALIGVLEELGLIELAEFGVDEVITCPSADPAVDPGEPAGPEPRSGTVRAA